MKVRLIAFLFLLTFLVEVRGFNPGDTNIIKFPIGSVNVVSNYCVISTVNLSIRIQQYPIDTTKPRITYINRSVLGPFPSKEIMDLMVQYELGEGIKDLILNYNGPIALRYGHDLSRPFQVLARAIATQDVDIYFETYQEFNLVKNGSAYNAPDLSNIKLGFPNRIPYKLNGVTWAHMKTTNYMSSTVRVDDSSVGSTNIWSIDKVGFFKLMIPCSEAINANGTNVSIRLNVLNYTNQFEVYENSQQVPEKLPEMKITLVQTPVSFSKAAMNFVGPKPYAPPPVAPSFVMIPPKIIVDMTGGEIGRTYSILTSTSVNGSYTDTGSRHRITPTTNSTSMTLDVIDGTRFFRLKSLNVPPTY